MALQNKKMFNRLSKISKNIILPYSTRKLSSSSVPKTHKFESIEPKKLFKTVITIPTLQNFFVKF
jgi:hypothetical protein